jgi:hypothetical protein
VWAEHRGFYVRPVRLLGVEKDILRFLLFLLQEKKLEVKT